MYVSLNGKLYNLLSDNFNFAIEMGCNRKKFGVRRQILRQIVPINGTRYCSVWPHERREAAPPPNHDSLFDGNGDEKPSLNTRMKT